MRSAVCRLRCQVSGGPSDVSDQFREPISAAISPPEVMNAETFARADPSVLAGSRYSVCANRILPMAFSGGAGRKVHRWTCAFGLTPQVPASCTLLHVSNIAEKASGVTKD